MSGFKPYYTVGSRCFYGMSTDDLPSKGVTGDSLHIIDTDADLLNYDGEWYDKSSGLCVEAKILSGKITISDVDYPIVFDGSDGECEVPYGTDVTSLLPDFTLSTRATISPSVAQDFTSPVTYTVTAEDTVSTTSYDITVTVSPEE